MAERTAAGAPPSCVAALAGTTQQLLLDQLAACASRGVLALYRGLTERLLAVSRRLERTDVTSAPESQRLALELQLVDIFHLLHATRSSVPSQLVQQQCPALCALREFLQVPQRAKFVLGLHDRVDALVTRCSAQFDDSGALKDDREALEVWERDCEAQWRHFEAAVKVEHNVGGLVGELLAAQTQGLTPQLLELWQLTMFWVVRPARLASGEQRILDRVVRAMRQTKLFVVQEEGRIRIPGGLVRTEHLAMVKKSSLPDWRRPMPSHLLLGASKNQQKEAEASMTGLRWWISPDELKIDTLHPSVKETRRAVLFGTWLDTPVILRKAVKKRNQPANEARASFQQEVRRWGRLTHPNVLRLFGACDTGATRAPGRYFVCESAAQGELVGFLQRQQVADGTNHDLLVWQKLLEAAQGLRYLHERGLAHGNLCVQHLLVGSDGLTKLAGFGHGLKANQTNEGIAASDGSLADDIFALGMCILKVVVGRETPWRKLPVQQPDAFSEDQWRLVRHMCASDPSERLKIAAVMHELQRLVHEASTLTSNPDVGFATLVEEDMAKIELVLATEALPDVAEASHSRDVAMKQQLTHRLDDLATKLLAALPETKRLTSRRSLAWALEGWHGVASRFHAFCTGTTRPIGATHAVRLIMDRKCLQQAYALNRELDQLVVTARLPQLTAVVASCPLHRDWKVQWRRQQLQQANGLCDALSDDTALLQEIRGNDGEESLSDWITRAQGVLAVLQFERNRQIQNYSAEELQAMNHAIQAITEARASAENGESVPLVDSKDAALSEWFLPPYEVALRADQQALGRGGFGSAHHGTWLDCPVVVKRVLGIAKGLTASSGEAIFKREADIWLRLTHPHVVALFGACHVGRPIFVCEYAAHGTLVAFLRRCNDNQRLLLAWQKLHEAALGLEYLHKRGVVHADLKGDNILVGRDSRAKLTDFGLSTLASKPDGVDSTGAVRWKAPECMGRNAQSPTFASDIYSLGMCVVEAVTGAFPWGSQIPDAAVSFHVRRGRLPPSMGAFSSSQWTLVKCMCSLDPRKRPDIKFVVGALRLAAMQQELQPLAQQAQQKQQAADVIPQVDAVGEEPAP